MSKKSESTRPAEADKLEHDDPALQGEGNYTAARRVRESQKKFIDDGKVAPAARDAAPVDAAEERELREAEKAGLARAKR